MSKILLADSDPQTARQTSSWIMAERHIVDLASSEEQVSQLILKCPYHLVLLEWQPSMNAVRLCRQLRQSGQPVPVVVVSKSASILDKQAAFGAGADDYLTRPFHYEEMILRIQALLRRPKVWLPDLLIAGWLELDRTCLVVRSMGKQIHFSQLEFNLLEFLIRHQGQVFSPDQLLKSVWSGREAPSVYALRHCLGKIRIKIAKPGMPSPIKNLRGAGYKFELSGSASENLTRLNFDPAHAVNRAVFTSSNIS